MASSSSSSPQKPSLSHIDQAFEKLRAAEVKDTDWLKWLEANSEIIPYTFIPNTKRLATGYLSGSRYRDNCNNNDMSRKHSYPHLATYHTLLTADKLRSKSPEIKTFKGYFESMAKNRRSIQKHLRSEGNADDNFGVIRKVGDNLVTHVDEAHNYYGDQYYPLLSGLLKYNEEAKKPGILIKQEFGFYKTCSSYPYEKAIKNPYYLLEFYIQKYGRTLSKITLADLRTTRRFMTYHHTLGKELEELFTIIDPIYQSIFHWKRDPQKSEKENERAFYYLLGFFIWHVAQATPCRRGTASIIKMSIPSMLIAHQFAPKFEKCTLDSYHFNESKDERNNEFSYGINLDLRAISTATPEEFAGSFYYLFEGTPDLKNDRFKVDLALIEKYKKVLLNTIERESKEGIKLFKCQHVEQISRYPYYESVTPYPDGLRPSVHRNGLFRINVVTDGHLFIKEKYKNSVKTMLDGMEKHVTSREKINLILEEDHGFAIFSALQQELGGEFFYNLDKAMFKTDLFTWINLKSLAELKNICDEHHIFEEAICWIERLSSHERELINENALSRDEMIQLGVKGLKRTLDFEKEKSNLPSSEMKILASVLENKPIKKKEIVYSLSLLWSLLTRLKYCVPPKRFSFQVHYIYSDNDNPEKEMLREHVIIALQKLFKSNLRDVKDVFTIEDYNALVKAQTVFLSARDEYAALVNFCKMHLSFPLPNDGFAFVSHRKQFSLSQLFYSHANSGKKIYQKENKENLKNLAYFLRCRDEQGRPGLFQAIQEGPCVLPELLQVLSETKEISDELAFALKLQMPNNLFTMLHALIVRCFELKNWASDLLPELWQALRKIESGPTQLVIALGLQDHIGCTGLYTAAYLTPNELPAIFSFFESKDEEESRELADQLALMLSIRKKQITYDIALMSTADLAPNVIELTVSNYGYDYRLIGGIDNMTKEKGYISFYSLPKNVPKEEKDILSNKDKLLPIIVPLIEKNHECHLRSDFNKQSNALDVIIMNAPECIPQILQILVKATKERIQELNLTLLRDEAPHTRKFFRELYRMQNSAGRNQAIETVIAMNNAEMDLYEEDPFACKMRISRK